MRSWCMLVHASASSGVGVQSWCMPRACQCIQRYGDVVLVCTRMPVRPVLKKCADAVLVFASAHQRIQHCGDAVLVYAARMPVHPAQRGRSPGVCSACQYVQCSKKKKNLSKVRKFTGVRQSKMRSGYLDICRGISSTPRNIAATPWDRAYPCTPAAACPMHGRAAVGVSEATRHARPELHTRYSRSNPARSAGPSHPSFTSSNRKFTRARAKQPGTLGRNFAPVAPVAPSPAV